MNLPATSEKPNIHRATLCLQKFRRKRDEGVASTNVSTKEVFHRKSGEDFSNQKRPATYCAGDSAGVSSAPAGDSVVAAGLSAAAGLVSVVEGAVVGAGVVT